MAKKTILSTDFKNHILSILKEETKDGQAISRDVLLDLLASSYPKEEPTVLKAALQVVLIQNQSRYIVSRGRSKGIMRVSDWVAQSTIIAEKAAKKAARIRKTLQKFK